MGWSEVFTKRIRKYILNVSVINPNEFCFSSLGMVKCSRIIDGIDKFMGGSKTTGTFHVNVSVETYGNFYFMFFFLDLLRTRQL